MAMVLGKKGRMSIERLHSVHRDFSLYECPFFSLFLVLWTLIDRKWNMILLVGLIWLNRVPSGDLGQFPKLSLLSVQEYGIACAWSSYCLLGSLGSLVITLNVHDRPIQNLCQSVP
jgi:hypothetical protein